ncbi:class II fructose-bisphosphate aldolase [Mycoplasma sp. SG1]|uniref:class II fructose-bisphosphate aldolase n=1 Tax=Mycoplasma sp. SG1 TaxID=2810348 RepID=UPI0020245D1D|nr:ketose-bisphosphate aldolase [Mycoplasma sp. SG1]URM53168.1 ketose-bisphosphate aldolase [Mycoplasma sp. SG1]
MLANTKKMILDAQKNGYAVPAFNVHDLVNILACCDAAKELRSPLILACTPATFKFFGMSYIVGICEKMAKMHDIPIALHMDHHHEINQIKQGLDLGIKSIMIDASYYSLEKNIDTTKEVVELCRKYDATVEAELGSVPGVEDDLDVKEANVKKWLTPEIVRDFCKDTDVDTIAVAFGTAHGIYHETPKLNIELLKDIKKICDTPLVMHGGSGLTKEQIRTCIAAGISKVNIGTELKAPYANSLSQFFQQNPKENDPRKFFKPAIEAVKKVAKEKILICRSNNRY